MSINFNGSSLNFGNYSLSNNYLTVYGGNSAFYVETPPENIIF